MKKYAIIYCFILFLFLAVTPGCIDYFYSDDGSTTYVSHPTKISYEIRYGYNISCTGSGDYNIKYDCDIPDVLEGNILVYETIGSNYIDKTIATFNPVKSWNFTSSANKEYDLGINAVVNSESYLVKDLTGSNAQSIQEISLEYPEYFNDYTNAQSNQTTTFIDPDDEQIKFISSELTDNLETDNAFIIAKELFKWLKQKTSYITHDGENIVQPAYLTFSQKTGDCDDLSFLYISLLRSVKIPARFIRGFLIEENKAIPHAWVEVFVGGNYGWIPVECAGTADKIETEINQNFAIETSDHLRLFVDDGSNESLKASLSGLYYVVYSSQRMISAKSFAEVIDYKISSSKELRIDNQQQRYYQ